MHDVSGFQQDATQLLQHLGFTHPALTPDQEVISLTVEQRFNLHLAHLDHAHWLMLASLEGPAPDAVAALRANQPSAQHWQPVLALDVDNRLCCWLRIPTGSGGLPTLLAAFDALIACAEQWLETGTASYGTEPTRVAASVAGAPSAHPTMEV